MAVPQDFERAYDLLVELTHRLSRGEVREEVLAEDVDAFRRDGCRGASTLAESAILALRYELSSEGLAAGAESVAAELRALGRIEQTLRPHSETRTAEAQRGQGESSQIIEVALPEQMRQEAPDARGFKMGELQIIFEPVAGPPYGHMSVSHPERYPSYEELLRARDAPGGNAPNLWALVPNGKEATRLHKGVVHLYVMPPEELLG